MSRNDLTAEELDAILADCDEGEWPSFRRSTIRTLVAMARDGVGESIPSSQPRRHRGTSMRDGMTDTQTAAELERAKKCRRFLDWEEHKSGRVSVFSKVSWLVFSGSFVTADDADARFAIVLRPVFASLAPVLFEEAAKVCEKLGNSKDGSSEGYEFVCADAIRRHAAKEWM